jgi:hypothetical protein
MRRKASGGWPLVSSTLDDHDFDMLTLLLIIFIVLAIGAAPAWPHSRSWGYYPSGGLGLVVVVLVVLALTGRMHL